MRDFTDDLKDLRRRLDEAAGYLRITDNRARLANPALRGKGEYFLSRTAGLGMDSNISQKNFSRRNLNLVIVLDISGSMESPFLKYYYGNSAAGTIVQKQEPEYTKLEAAIMALAVSA